MRVQVRLASSDADVVQCQQLIADIYNRQYQIRFSEDHSDLDAKIEPWPQKYLMFYVNTELIGAIGLYVGKTYVGQYGDVSRQNLASILASAGASARYDTSRLREVTKLVVHPEYRGRGIAKLIIRCAHSSAFSQSGSEHPHLLVCCATRSIIRELYDHVGLRPRHVRPFPLYRAHEQYRSEANPMDSWLLIPDLDIPVEVYRMKLPNVFTIPDSDEAGA